MAIQKAKAEPAEAQKRAKNCKEARFNKWASLLMFGMGLVLLCGELRLWQSKPSLHLGFGIISAGGFMLAGAFLRADAKKTLRRGGEKPESFGYQIALFVVAMSRFFGEGILPLSFLPWLLLVWGGVTLAMFAWLTLRLRRIRRTRNKGTQ